VIWLSWRHLRTQAVLVYALVAVCALTLAITGPELLRLAHLGGSVFDKLSRTQRNLFTTGIMVLALAPAVIGAFWGAPLVAREVESGTHRLVWNQTVTRARWLGTKLALTTLAGALATGALTLAVTWWASPVDGSVSDTHGGLPARLTPVAFAMRGVTPVAYTVFAVALGVAVGAVLRRSVPAMAATLALYTFVQIAVPFWVRPHLVPLVITLATGDPRNWVLADYTVDASGRPAALPSWTATECLPPPPGEPALGGRVKVPGDARSQLANCFARLDAEGYRQHLTYQPANHFWPLQWAETGLYLVLSGLLAAFCFWWVRTRVT
jgi:hypothetical protein